jgi:acetyl esterase/lipase
VVPFQVPDGVEVRHLRAFVAVAEELNFSRAAERLYVSQPALSRQIRTLERIVGCELLRRSTHHVELTLAGEALLDRARPVLAALEEAVAAARSVGGELAARVMRLWAPVLAVATAEASVDAMRDVFERFLADTQGEPELAVRPVTAGGVPGLVVGDEPAILFLHGGGYALGSAYGYRPLVARVAAAAGAGALIPDFRLAPEHPFPAALDDALAAYRWLLERRGDPARIVLAGDSSGAALALGMLLRLREDGESLPAGAALLSPSIDLTGELLAPNLGPELLAELERTAAAYLDGHPVDDPIVSPLRADLAGLPPTLVQGAADDLTRPEVEALVARLSECGVDAQLELYGCDAHVFYLFWSFLPEAADALASAGEFMRDALDSDADAGRRSA